MRTWIFAVICSLSACQAQVAQDLSGEDVGAIAESEVCRFRRDSCDEGLVCRPTEHYRSLRWLNEQFTPYECSLPGTIGEPCVGGHDEHCESGSCKMILFWLPGDAYHERGYDEAWACAPDISGIGQPCTDEADCDAGLHCVPPEDTNSFVFFSCQPDPDYNPADPTCVSEGDCADGYVCRPASVGTNTEYCLEPGGPHAPCLEDNDCISQLCSPNLGQCIETNSSN